MDLPFDFHRTPGTVTRFAGHAFDLPAPASSDAAVAAAFGVLLSRYNGQPSVVLNASRIAGGAAPWNRPLPLSTPAEASGRSVLAQAQKLLGGAIEAGFSFTTPQTGGAAVTFVDSWPSETALSALAEGRPEDLHLVVAPAGDGARAAFLYNAGLFKPTSIERTAGHLKELLTALAASPDAPLSRFRLLAPEERAWIEAVCTGLPRAALPEYVHRAFERQAAAAPRATAVRYGERSLSYEELNALANALAARLMAQGIAAESRVVVCLEPSFDAVIALLAVLKAGGVYVPLDPTHPAARLRALLEDVAPRVIVTRSSLLEKVGVEGTPALLLGGEDEPAPDLASPNPSLHVQPDQTAYVYFTSGTTGTPKGAAASQANLASYVAAARERYEIGPADVMPAIARFSFSISMFELMAPLTSGGTLLVLDRDHIVDLERMSRTLQEVTIFHAGPSLLKSVVAHIKRRYADFSAFSRVRHASSGGDMVAPELLEALKEIFSRAEVFVIYGCSEISCMGCTYPVPRDRVVERTYVGRPFDGVAVRVLDAALNLLPVGVVGEICFAGDGVVKGYLNRPDLTAQRFIELEGRRFYRTGDMGRLSEDGWLEILGRSDYQIKLRGMRVELGEIEHYLRRAAGVRDGVVTTKPVGGDEKALVAYFVMDRDRPLDPSVSPIEALQRHLATHLPEYMVPGTYIELESLPLNHNMKVDRSALPAPEPARARAGAAVRAPRTDTEKRLAGLWIKLLGIDRVGLDDHFFDLGGHSLLGLQLMLEVERELGAALKGMEVLRESLEGQAALCDRRLGKRPAADAPAPVAAPHEPFEAFYFGQGGSLYGVLSASGAARASDAVLICPPAGQDQLRVHFVLQRLAARLAAQGVPALRFDYYGCGDSAGESLDADCGRWRSDIGEAYRELKKRTGASRITAIGVRLGAALLAGAADGLDLASLVLWDPVCDGAAFYDETARTHDSFVRGWRWLLRRPPPCAPGAVELLGLACSERTASEIKELRLEPALAGGRVPLKWLAASPAGDQRARFEALARGRDGSRLEVLDFDPGWNDVSRQTALLPDVGVSKALARLATERA
jgi:amino acid adenylation domain-containing protein